MHDFLIPKDKSKEEKYRNIVSQIESLVEKEIDIISILSNISAAIHQTFKWLWVGFYIVKGDELILGPFQGPVACFRIKKGEGVCGKTWLHRKTIIVPDVEKFPGAACSLGLNQAVLPIFKKKNYGVLDIDSDKLNTFDRSRVP